MWVDNFKMYLAEVIEYEGREWFDYFGYRKVGGTSEYGNELPIPWKAGYFFEKLSDYQLIKKDSAPLNNLTRLSFQVLLNLRQKMIVQKQFH
jgi:hypothetical protein